jgi:hypothetical protein
MSWREWVEQPKKVVSAISGKRTHIAVLVALVLSFLEAFNIWTPPVWVWTILGFAGLGFLRLGVKNTKTIIEQMMKELQNMKKLIIIAVGLIALCMGTMVKANGITVWGLTEQDLNSQNAITARVGYQYDFVEGFLGSTWRPNYDVDTGEVKPPQVLSLGALVHMRDLLDPNNPLPWIPQALLTFLPEEMVAQPYFGGQGTWNLGSENAGFYGAIIGIQTKTKEDAKASFITEFDYNTNFKDLSVVPDQWRLNLGFRFLF